MFAAQFDGRHGGVAAPYIEDDALLVEFEHHVFSRTDQRLKPLMVCSGGLQATLLGQDKCNISRQCAKHLEFDGMPLMPGTGAEQRKKALKLTSRKHRYAQDTDRLAGRKKVFFFCGQFIAVAQEHHAGTEGVSKLGITLVAEQGRGCKRHFPGCAGPARKWTGYLYLMFVVTIKKQNTDVGTRNFTYDANNLSVGIFIGAVEQLRSDALKRFEIALVDIQFFCPAV